MSPRAKKDPPARVVKSAAAPRTARLPPAPSPFDALVDLLAAAVATRVAERLPEAGEGDGYYSQYNSPLTTRVYLDLVRDKQLPARVVGKSRLVKKSVLHAWIEQHALSADVAEAPGAPRKGSREAEDRRLDAVLKKNSVGREG